jgi:integrase
MTTELIPFSHQANQLVRFQAPRANTLYNRIQEYLATQFTGLAPSTYRNVKTSLELFELYAGQHPISAPLVSAFPAWLDTSRHRLPTTIRKITVHLKRFLRWAYRLDYLPKDFTYSIPAVMIPRPPLPLIFSHAEYERLRDDAEGTPMQWAFILAYHTGLDLVDVCFFRWASVDLSAMVIRATRTKTKRFGEASISQIPIITGSDLHVALTRRAADSPRNAKPDDFVCPELAAAYTWVDTNIHQTFLRFIRKRCPRKTFKTFRRTFCSNVANSGMNIALACRMTAHSKPDIFLRYIRPDVEASRAGLETALQYAKDKSR